MKIRYAEDIIVLVRVSSTYKWYVSDKELWILDYRKYAQNFNTLDQDFSSRFNIPVVDETTVERFLKLMESDRVPQFLLQKELKKHMPCLDWDEVGHLFPTMFVDFENRKLFSLYPENIQFEKYIPQHWEGDYEDFYNLVPKENKYWFIDKEDKMEIIKRAYEQS